MSALVVTLIVVGLILLIPVLWAIGAYNGLVTLRNRYRNAFAQIDVQLKRRYELIPNLVETAKAFLKHERETLEAVIQARNAATGAREAAAANPEDSQAVHQLANAESGLTGTLGRLFALSESYPELRSNQNMMQLTEELTATENKIAFARQAYNDAVMVYNTKTETFPTNLFAGMFNFVRATLFEVSSEAEREAVKVSFD